MTPPTTHAPLTSPLPTSRPTLPDLSRPGAGSMAASPTIARPRPGQLPVPVAPAFPGQSSRAPAGAVNATRAGSGRGLPRETKSRGGE